MSDISLEQLKKLEEAPLWMTAEGFQTLSRGYLLPDETPKNMYQRVAFAAADRLKKPELRSQFFNILWDNWLCLASPVCSNMGTERGLPISCYSSTIPDSLDGIFTSIHETAMLSKYGGGLGHYWGNVRGRGVPITGNGFSEGIVPWLKTEDAVISSVSQGGVRRGSSASYLPVSHIDIEEFIDIRRPTGDDSRRCRSTGFHHAVIFDNNFMDSVVNGGNDERRIWSKYLKTRWEMGEPYAQFIDNVNDQAPQMYKDLNLKINASNLCNEIQLHSDDDHTFVCCISSLNLARYDEWKNSNCVQLSLWFLDAVMTEFIEKAKTMTGFEKAVRFAEKSRALGLGVLGWHTLLQNRNIPFESFQAMMLNAEIFKIIDQNTLKATQSLAQEYGEPEWCKGYGIRNSHRIAIAPTLSNSIISGGLSEGIQPVISNIYAQKSAKGTFIRRNKTLEILLESKNKNTNDVWNMINSDKGSVRNLDFLTPDEKTVFATAREINQFTIIRQAAQRQRFIDQGQSLNLFFTVPTTSEEQKLVAKYVHDVHIEAWNTGVKGLYYLRTESSIKGDSIYFKESDCAACEA